MLVFCVIVPCLMTVFGILAIYNTKQVRIQPVHITHHRRNDCQLGFMLLIQVSTFILLNSPVCVVYIMISFLPVTSLTATFSFATPFFLYIISGRIFRKELMCIFKRIMRCQRDNYITPITNHRADAEEPDQQ